MRSMRRRLLGLAATVGMLGAIGLGSATAALSTVPVQNGKADYTITATATFSPECSPPMTVQFTSATLTDTTNNLSVTLIP